MKLNKIKVAAYDIEICFWDYKEARENNRWGEFSVNEQKIRIDNSMTGALLIDTLIHEINHAIYWAYNIEDEDKEERIVTKMSTGLTQVLRDNPELLAFIKKHLSNKI